MSLVIWNPAWETGIELIDQQHQALLAQFEALLVAIRAEQSEAQIPELLAFLAMYVESHFSMEETHMQATHYQGFPGHKAIHDAMRLQVANLLTGVKENPGMLTEEVVNFLTNWLLHHINEEDRIMARHLRLAIEDHPRIDG